MVSFAGILVVVSVLVSVVRLHEVRWIERSEMDREKAAYDDSNECFHVNLIVINGFYALSA